MLLTPKQVAARLNCSLPHVSRLCSYYERVFELVWPVLKTTPQPPDFWWQLHQLTGALTRPDNKEQA